MNACLTEEQKAMVAYTDEQLVALETDTAKFKFTPDISWTATDTLVLEENVWLKYRITLASSVTANAEEMKLVYWSADTYGKVEELTLENADGKLDIEANGSMYQACIEGIAPKNMGMSYYACLYVKNTDGSEHYTNVVIYSIHNYASRMVGGTYGETLADLCKTMVTYSDMAKTYFGG